MTWGSEDPLQSALLLYAEGILVNGPTRRDPPWFQFGVANLLNGRLIRSDGSILLNRKVPFEPDDVKNGSAQRFDLPKLLAAGAADLNGAATLKEFMRLAREWAQFGLLTTEQRRAQYHELATLMRQGHPPTRRSRPRSGYHSSNSPRSSGAVAGRRKCSFG